MSLQRDMRELLQRAEQRGWVISRTGGNHLRIEHPQIGTPVFAAATPSDYHAVANCRALLIRVEREAGLIGQAQGERERGESPGAKLQSAGGLALQLERLMDDFPELAMPTRPQRIVDGVDLNLPVYGAVPPVPVPKWLRQPPESGESSTGHAPDPARRLVIPGHRVVSISDRSDALLTARPEDVATAMAVFARSLGMVDHPIVIRALATKRKRDHAARIRGRWRRRDV